MLLDLTVPWEGSFGNAEDRKYKLESRVYIHTYIATLLLVVGIVSGELVSVTRNQFGFIARELKTLVAALQQAAEKAG